MSKRTQLAIMACATALLAGCSGADTTVEPGQESTSLGIVALAQPFRQAGEAGESRAGTLPPGYVPYSQLYPAPAEGFRNFGIFLTPERTTLSTFTYAGLRDGIHIWNTNATIAPGNRYYIYGFMPREGAENATIQPLDGDFSRGAILTVNNFSTLSAADVCAVVGLRKSGDQEEITDPDADVVLGNFAYEAGERGENNIFVLLKHIYSGLHFKLCIDAAYHELRSIKVTGMTLIATDATETVDVSLTLRANDIGADPLDVPVSITPIGSATAAHTTLFAWEGSADELDEIPVSEPDGYLGCFAPGSCSHFVLRTTYNVYDRKGNLIREGCMAENLIDGTQEKLEELGSLQAGEVFTINLLVQPTFLYVLSDPDLDNPTITIANP